MQAARAVYTRGVNVVVIGAGVVGAAIAQGLACRGVAVDLVDMREPGAGSTQAAAGMLAPWIEAHTGGLLTLAEASLARYDAFVRALEAQSGVSVEYARRGTLEVAFTSGQEAALREAAGRHAARGVAYDWLDGDGARALEPGVAAGARAGLWLREQGYVRARDLTAALTAGLAKAGGRLHAGVRVEAVEDRGGVAAVRTAEGLLEADAVVLAAGSWSGGEVFRPAAATPVVPVRGQLLHLEADAPMCSRVVWGPDCYLVPWQDGSLLVGGTVEHVGFDERSTPDGIDGLRRAAAELLPASATARLREVRVGLRPGTPDHMPLIGCAAASSRVVFATGHYRNGVLLAPLTAELVAGLLTGAPDPAELALTAPGRFGL